MDRAYFGLGGWANLCVAGDTEHIVAGPFPSIGDARRYMRFLLAHERPVGFKYGRAEKVQAVRGVKALQQALTEARMQVPSDIELSDFWPGEVATWRIEPVTSNQFLGD